MDDHEHVWKNGYPRGGKATVIMAKVYHNYANGSMMSGRLLLLLLAFSGVWRTKQSFLQNAPDAPYGCCMICTHIIDTEVRKLADTGARLCAHKTFDPNQQLTFLSISEEKRAQTRENIQNWIDVNSFLQVEVSVLEFEISDVLPVTFSLPLSKLALVLLLG